MRFVAKSTAALMLAGLFTVAAPARADVERVETVPSSGPGTLGIVAKDALYGGVAGALVGGGIIFVQNGGFNIDSNYNWGRTLGLSAGIGILAGAAYGIFDAASSPRYATAAPLSASLSDPLAPKATMNDMSGKQLFTVKSVAW